MRIKYGKARKLTETKTRSGGFSMHLTRKQTILIVTLSAVAVLLLVGLLLFLQYFRINVFGLFWLINYFK